MQVLCQVLGARRSWFPCVRICDSVHSISFLHISLPYLLSNTTVFFSFPPCTKLQTDESNVSDTAQVAITIRILFLDYTTKRVLRSLPLQAG